MNKETLKTRPDWDAYFMSLALFVSSRSIDPRTKHGSVLVDNHHRVLSTGYNGPPKGCYDDMLPLDSDSKYFIMVHSELNAIIQSRTSNTTLDGFKCYVTGRPCLPCLCHLINAGCTEVIYGPIWSHCVTSEQNDLEKLILTGQKIKIREYKDIQKIFNLFNTVTSYLNKKLEAKSS